MTTEDATIDFGRTGMLNVGCRARLTVFFHFSFLKIHQLKENSPLLISSSPLPQATCYLPSREFKVTA